ncbi:MAG: HipA domain-containing protein [Candidatus Omnitrophota bacterium]|nr:HipA domain-containing protein [Candidatus Omnitrophota bacterium]MBU4468485.1 HipA domain-containing protein [Candidatus Omnitrophota bacterium]MCG2707212.1 HipA domain-containing protein [Candidatus Omnitrophota bacterium]MDP3042352.1 HipA domain-containing protein [Candidatus Omnitrophota bacterium]
MNEKIIKKMFNTSELPIIDFNLQDVSQKAQKSTGKLSISGVQPKLSMKLDKKNNSLISVAEGGEYILKPQTAAFSNIPENEQCCMDIAAEFDINVPPHCLLPLKDRSWAYIVKRFDRESGLKIHQEDFFQILESGDKYKGSVEQIGRKLKEISTAPGYDVQLFFERVVFNFIIGNGDAHLKNYAIAYRDKETIRLTPAYDIVCSKLVIPDEEDSALSINSKKNGLKRDDFDKLAEYLNIPIKIRYEKFEKSLTLMETIIKNSEIKKEIQEQFINIINERLSRMGIAAK